MDCDIARFDSPVPTRGRRRSVTPVRTGGFGGGGGCDTTPCAAERSTGRRRAAASLQPSATTPRRHSARRTGEAASVAAAAAPPPSPLWFAQTAGDGWAGGAAAAADERQALRERRVDQSVHHHEPHWFGSVSCPAAAPEQSVCGGGGGSGRGSSRQEHQKSVLSEFRSIQEADRAQAARMHKRRYPSHPSLAVSVGKENLPCSQRGRAAPAAAPYKPLAAPYGTSSDCPQPPSLAATPAPHAAAREGTRATPHGGVERPAERCRQMKQLSEALSTYRLRQRR